MSKDNYLKELANLVEHINKLNKVKWNVVDEKMIPNRCRATTANEKQCLKKATNGDFCAVHGKLYEISQHELKNVCDVARKFKCTPQKKHNATI